MAVGWTGGGDLSVDVVLAGDQHGQAPESGFSQRGNWDGLRGNDFGRHFERFRFYILPPPWDNFERTKPPNNLWGGRGA